MGRKPKGKALTLRPIRLDDDVWAECRRLGKEHGTINEGMAAALAALEMQEAQGRVEATTRTLTPVVPYQHWTQTQRPFKGPLLKPSAKDGK